MRGALDVAEEEVGTDEVKEQVRSPTLEKVILKYCKHRQLLVFEFLPFSLLVQFMVVLISQDIKFFIMKYKFAIKSKDNFLR